MIKISAQDFQLLVSYIEKKAPGQVMTLNFQQNSYLEVKLTNALQEDVVISIPPADSTSFAKISVNRRLGDEIK